MTEKRAGCPVCGGKAWRWTDHHGVATCGQCGADSALLPAAATEGAVLPQSLLKPEWLVRYRQWWATTAGKESFKDWWEKTDVEAGREKERRKNALLASKQNARLTLDELVAQLKPLKGDTHHCDPAVTCNREGTGGWTVHLQPWMRFLGPDDRDVELPWFKGPDLRLLLDDLAAWLNENVSTITLPSGYHTGGTFTLAALVELGDLGKPV